MISPWKKIRYRLEWVGIFILARFLPLLPRKLLLALARILGRIGYLFDHAGRKTALQNLTAVFGNEKSPEEIERIAKCSYQSLARTVCDQFWSSRLTRENFTDYCHYETLDPDAIEATRKTGAIWVTPHYGNFEWISLGMGFQDHPFTVVAQEFKNPLITDFFKHNREHSGHTVIPQRRAMIRLLNHLRDGGNAAFLTDLTVPPSKAATVIDCMGFKTCVTLLHGALAKKSQLPIFAGISIPQEDGTYLMKQVLVRGISESSSPREIAQACWDAFESEIQRQPEHWIWMYKHWRYHPAGEGEKYPPYSNPLPAFEHLLDDARLETG